VGFSEPLDPAEYLLKNGAASFSERIAGAVDALTHAFKSSTLGIDLQADVPGAMRALDEIGEARWRKLMMRNGCS